MGSKIEDILQATIDGATYDEPASSRIEELLIELKEMIEAGGSGGITSYESLTGKPKINGYTLSGDVSLNDIGAASEDDLATKQNALSAAQLAAANSGIDSTKVAQIETNKNNILLIAPITTTVNYAATTGDTWEKVPVLSFTVPANSNIMASASVFYNNTSPRGCAITYDESTLTYANTYALSENPNNYKSITATGIINNPTNAARTYNVFVKYANANVNNPVTLTIQALTNINK